MIGTNGLATSSGIEVLPVILLLSGFFLIIASLFRVSFIVQFVSRTVITAYVTAAAFLIIANQCRHVLGLTLGDDDPPSTFIGILLFLFSQTKNISLPALFLSACTSALLYPASPSIQDLSKCCDFLGYWFGHCIAYGDSGI